MSIDANTGVFSWTPTEGQGGLAPSVTVTVTDNGTGALTDSETFTITVGDTNLAPVLAAIGNQSANEGATLTFTASATDADLPSQTLTYSLDVASLALGMTINSSTGVFSWTPSEAQGGLTPSVTVTVTDNGTGNLTDSETFTITVGDTNLAPVLAVIGNQSVAEGAALNFTATATDADLPIQTLSYTLDAASLALGMTINNSTGAFSWTPTEAQGGLTPSVTITVTDNGSGNLTDTETFTITVGDTNLAPVLAAIGNQSVNEGATLSFTATATDADVPANTLTYSLDGASLALGMSINSSTGAFSWTPTEAQGGLTPAVTITVTDNGSGLLTDSETFSITVGDTNVAPVLAAIGNQTVNEGATLTFTATASDADLPVQSLSYSLDAASLALGMTIDVNTGTFSWTPTEAQGGLTPSVTITVTDNGTGNLTDSETFTISVGDTNLAPVLAAIGNQSVAEGATLTFTAIATDPDLPSQTLTYSLDAASIALGMTIDANTGVFSWTPSEAQGGLTPSVTVTVTDNGTGNLTDSETFTITVGDTNLAPVLAVIGNQSVNEGATLSFTATATDADVPAQSLTYSLDAASLALGMTINSSTGAFNWTPSESQGGLTPSVTITVTDNGSGNLTDTETFNITVGDTNLAPVLAAIGNQSVNEGGTLNFTASATDPDLPAQSLTYSLDAASLALGMTINSSTGAFSWTPTEAQGGLTPSVTITVTDNGTGNLMDSETFMITVGDTNVAPVLAAIGNQAVNEGATLSLTATATDADVPSQSLSYSLDAASIALGMSINSSTGTFSWTPTEAQGGLTPSVTVTVTDNGSSNLTDSETFTITVGDTNLAPVLTVIGNQAVNEGATLSFTATATDADVPGQTLTYSLDAASIALGMSIDANTGAFSWTPSEAQGGLAPSVTITVTDNGTGNLTDSETFIITVGDTNTAPVLAAIGNQSVNEGATLSFTASATDPDLPAQSLTYSLDAASLALGMSINSSTGAFSWTPTEAQGGLTPSVTITVTDNGTGNLTDSETFTITVNDSNVAPVLAGIGNQAVNEGATLSFTATATDADVPSQTLTYSLDAASLALGMSIDANTGVFSWTPTEGQGGLAPSVTVTVTDNGTGALTDSETFTITVGDTNLAPVLAAIGNQSVNEGATLTFTASATDADLPSQSLTYSLDAASIALGMTINSSTGAFSWTPTEAQGGLTPSVTVTVTDNGTGLLTDSETFTITVGDTNLAPVLTAIGNQSVNEGATLSFTASATDPDLPAQSLSYSLDAASLALGMTINSSTGVFSWTPTEAQGGLTPSVTVTVTDNGTGLLTDSETFTITVNDINTAPVLAAIGNQTVNEGSTLTFTATATDADLPANTLTYSLDAASIALGMSIDANTGAFSWTPTESQGGLTPSVTITVTDNGSLTDSETFTITVGDTNLSPVLAAIGNQSVNEGETLNFTASATDADVPAQSLSYSLDAASIALGMSINSSTGVFSWTPSESQGGTAPSVTITVTDNGAGNLIDSETFTISVGDTNLSPVLAAIGNQSVNEGETLNFTASATDADVPAQSLSYSLDAASLALGMTINSSTGAFSWTPSEAQSGLTPSVTITVTDNGTGNLTDSETFTISVGEVNTAPVLAAIGNQSVNEGATLSFTASATDADVPAQSLSYSLDAASIALGMSINSSTGVFSWTPSEAQGGLTPSVTITVTDNGTGNLTDSETFTITLGDTNVAPVLGAIGNQSVNEGATLSFTATATDADLPAQSLGYSLDAASLTLGMSINSATGAFSWTPTEAQGGLIPSVTITVTDNGTGNLTDSETFTITVADLNVAPVLAAIGNQSVSEGATLSFTASATDADLPAQSLSYSLDAASLALGMSINSSTGVFSWTPSEAQGGLTPSVTITVTDNGSGNLTDSETFTITVDDTNAAPVLAAIGNQSVNEGATLNFTASATDPDLPAQSLTYSLDAASLALGMSINSSTGVFSWTPTEAQGSLTPSVTVTVTDNGTGLLTDSETFTITVNDINTAPVLAAIGNQTVNEGSTLTFTATATDADLPANTLTYSLDAASIALGMSIDANTGVFSWTPSEAQGGLTPSVTITVTDNGTGNLTDSETFTITVGDTNLSPVLAAIGNQSVAEGATLTFTAIATDPDLPSQTLTYSLDAASIALGMTIDANTGVFSWTPAESQGGLTPSVTITVTDNGTGNLTDSETFTVTVGDTNLAPVLTAIGNQSVNEGATLSFTATATDADLPAQSLSYSLDAASLALGMTINSSTGAFSWTPTEAQGGLTPSVTVTVTDNGTGLLTDSETFTITVGDTNLAPVLAAIGNQTVNEGSTLTFTATATDADLPANTLTYSLDAASIALGMSIDANTGAFSWTPTEAQGGLTPSVTITVTDNGTGNLTDSETFTITVGDSNVAPVLAGIGNQAVNEGATLSFTASATDADLPAQTLTYSLDAASIALGMSIDANTGAFSWTPSEAQGSLTPSVTVTVTDSGTSNLTDSETFTITVGEVNVAPILGSIGNKTVAELTELTFTASATDADLPASTLTYSLDAASIALGMTINSSTGVFSWTPTESQDGIHAVTVTVTDNGTGTLSDSETITVTVNEVNVAPVLGSIGNQTIAEGSPLTFTATATDADLPANSLTYSLSGTVPTGASITSGGVFSWTPTETQGPGSYSFDVIVSDGALTDVETITVTVTEGNTAPVLAAIGDKTVDELTALTFTATATDADLPANTLTYSLDAASIALGMTIDANTGVFSWTPTEAQGGLTPSVTITVTDNGTGNLTDSETFTITVGEINTAPVLAAIGNQTVNEGATLSFTATATDADLPGQTLTYSLDAASLSLGMTIDANTGVFNWTPTEAQGSLTPSVTVTVTDSGTSNMTDSETFTITVGDTNLAPVLAAIGNQTVNEGATLSFTASATDADLPSQTLTYSLDAASIALGMTINSSTGAFSWTPSEAQGSLTPSVTVTVTDSGTSNLTDSETFTITVGDTNLAPVLAAIGNRSVNEGATLSFTASATDADLPGQTLTYSLDAASLSLGMTIDSSTGAFSWTPTETQGSLTPSVTVTVTDSGTSNLTDSETFTITVGDTNLAPVLAAIGNQSVNEGATLNFTASATDADLPSQTLTYSLDAASIALGMTIDANTGAFSWTPAESQGGLAPSVTITVTDNGTGNLTDSETFTISVGDTNLAPVLTAIGNQTVNEGATLSFIATATDADLPSQTLTYSLDVASLALGMTINSSTGVFSWTPSEAQGGLTPSVTVTVTDNGTGNLTDSETFTVTVGDTNLAPVLTAIGNQSVNEGATLSFTATATDADLPAQNQSYSLDPASLALGMSIDANTGVFSWTPTETQGGLTPSVTITVTDNGTGNLTDSETFTITVGDTNLAPVLGAIGNQSVNEGATLSFTATATDADLPSQTLTYSLYAASIALGMSIDANTGAFSWTPTEAQGGLTPSVTITVTDNGSGNLTDSETFTIMVADLNSAPVTTPVTLVAVAEDSGARVITQTELLANAGDMDGDSLIATSLGITSGNGSLVDNGDGTWTYTPAQNDSSAVSFSYTISDGAASVAGSATMDISSVNEVPAVGGDRTGAVTEDVDPDADGLLEVSGVLTISDPDAGESSFLPATIVGTYGSLTIDAAGNWSYAADNTRTAIQQLDARESITDVLTITSMDGTTHSVTITIHGVKENPVVDGSTGSDDEGGADPKPGGGAVPIETQPEAKPDKVLPMEAESPAPEGIDHPNFRKFIVPGSARYNWTPPRHFVSTISLASPAQLNRVPSGPPLVSIGFTESLKGEGLKTARADRIEGNVEPSATGWFSAEAIVQELDRIQKQINDQLEMEATQGKLIIGVAAGLGASVFVGYVVWVFRAASLLLGALSAMPMWRCFDPLPVLIGKDKKRDKDKEKKSGGQESEVDEKRVRDLLDSGKAVKVRQSPKEKRNWNEAL